MLGKKLRKYMPALVASSLGILLTINAGVASDVMAYAQAEAIENGKHWNGYKLVEGRSVRKFSDEAKVEAAAKEAGYTDIYNKSLITLTAFEKLMGKEAFAEILGQYVTKPAGKLTLVPVSDKRPEVSVNTVNDEFMED